MKKVIAVVGLLGLGFLFFGAAEAEARPRFFLGGYAEVGHYLTYQGYGFVGEIGVQITDVFSLVAEAGTGSSTVNYHYQSSYSTETEKLTLSVTPFIFAVHFTAPLGNHVQPYVGVGIASWNLKMTDEVSYRYTYYPTEYSSTTTTKFSSVAPIFKIGVAVSVIKNVWVVGEYRQIVAKDKFVNTSSYSTSETDVYFGSGDLKFGVRIVI